MSAPLPVVPAPTFAVAHAAHGSYEVTVERGKWVARVVIHHGKPKGEHRCETFELFAPAVRWAQGELDGAKVQVAS